MMENLPQEQPLHPFTSIVVFVATVFFGFIVIGPIVGFLFAMPFYDGSFKGLVADLTSGNAKESIRVPFFIMQGCTSAVGLIVVPMLAYRFIAKMKVGKLFSGNPIATFVLTGVTVIAFMFPNSFVIEWNSKLDFSGSFWTWARELEERGEILTKFLTNFKSPGEFAIAFVILAILPAIGEEFTFRGWLQPAVQKLSGNPHIAIWTAAFFFSAIHFQFFGFVPRMLLGAIFGYLMFWSNNLWLPITAHFVNNGFSVVMLYLHQLNIVEFDAESNEALPLSYVIPFAILFLFLMVYLKKKIQEREETT
jgi:uncharacterized protein